MNWQDNTVLVENCTLNLKYNYLDQPWRSAELAIWSFQIMYTTKDKRQEKEDRWLPQWSKEPRAHFEYLNSNWFLSKTYQLRLFKNGGPYKKVWQGTFDWCYLAKEKPKFLKTEKTDLPWIEG